MASVSETITAQNSFTASIGPGEPPYQGYLNLSVSGTWVGTVTVQRSFDGVNWLDVEAYTANVQARIDDQEHGVRYRAGIKTSGYTSGAAVIRLSN